jgi:hypothetical protein
MARREFARTTTDMPEEPSIKALDVGPQWLYDRMRYRPEISRCGAIPWCPAVFTELAPDATEVKIRRWARRLSSSGHVVVDESYAECLVRTYVRWDGLLAQPNVVPHLVYDYGLIASTKVRVGFLREFRRLWDLPDLKEAERGGWLLAVGHFPRRKYAADDPAKWPVALETTTLARLIKEVGIGIRDALTSAIDSGEVAPFDPDSPYGVPDPFHPPHQGTPSPQGVGGTPSPYPTDPPPRRAHTDAPTRAGAPTGNGNRLTANENGSRLPSSENGNDVRATGPDQPAATAAGTHTPVDPVIPNDPAELVATHGGRLTGAVRLALTDQARQLLNDDIEPVTIAAALALWRQRPGSGPGLLAYLANDLLLDAALPKKPTLTANGSAPTWCGHCDQHSRWHDTGNGWTRCPTCHPLNADRSQPQPEQPAATSSRGEEPDTGELEPAGAVALAGPDDPPF